MAAMPRKSKRAAAEITKRTRLASKPAPARYTIVWQNPITREYIQIRIIHTRDYLGQGQDHVQTESIKPKRAALPITATGYLSHFISGLELMNAGGPVSLITSWIEREASTKKWRATAIAKAQGDLFGWIDATHAATGRKPVPGRKHASARKAPPPNVTAVVDYLADREAGDDQMHKRMAARDRGKKPKPPREP